MTEINKNWSIVRIWCFSYLLSWRHKIWGGSLTHVLVAVTLLTITFRNQCKPVRNHLLTTTSSRPPSAVASCRQGRRQPTADVGRHRFVLSGQACCPWSAASTPGKCSAEETWAVNEESSCSVFLEAWREAKRRVWVRRNLLLPTTCFCLLYPLVSSLINYIYKKQFLKIQ